MNRIIKEKRAHWIGGTLTAVAGVALAKLVSPELAGTSETIALAAGYALVVAGLAIIACATRRDGFEAFVAQGKHGED